MGEPILDRSAVRMLRAIQRVRNQPNFQGFLEHEELNSHQRGRADELCAMQGEDPAYCLFGIVDDQVTLIVHPVYTHLIPLTEASES